MSISNESSAESSSDSCQATRFLLEEMTYDDTRKMVFDTAILPLGATEPHNLHLPYATDTLEANVIGKAICQRAVQLGARVVLLPTIPYGTETNMRFLPLAMNVNPSTLYAMITDLVESVSQSGIRRMVILNSHGGNEIKPLLRELAGKTEVHLFLCDWFRIIGDCYHEIFEQKEDHAGEAETSIIMSYFPHLVRHLPDGSLHADDGATRKSQFEAVNRGWVSITRRWDLLTTNTGSGNPHAANADKGKRVVQLLADRVGPFIAELGQAKLDDSFPFA